jgi:hypothetical protein
MYGLFAMDDVNNRGSLVQKKIPLFFTLKTARKQDIEKLAETLTYIKVETIYKPVSNHKEDPVSDKNMSLCQVQRLSGMSIASQNIFNVVPVQ